MALHVVLRGTALPSSPVDGEELYYVADTTSRVIWHLRYNAGSSSSYKWEMLGEPPLRKHVETAESPTTANTWVDLTTDGPGIAVPLAGEYWLAYGLRVTATNVAATFEMTARPWVAGADVGAPNAGHTTVGTTQSNNYASVAARETSQPTQRTTW